MKLSGQAASSSEKRDPLPRWRRVVRRTLRIKLGLVLTLGALAAIALLRLVWGPVSLSDYSGRVADGLAARIGPGWSVVIGDTAIEILDRKPAVRAAGLEIRNPAGILVVRAPYATVSLDPMALLAGGLSPRAIELRDLQLIARVARDGTLSFLPESPSGPSDGSSGADQAAAALEPAKPSFDDPAGSVVSHALASLLDPVIRSTSLVGALDRATVSNARLTLVGAGGRERVAFNRVGALFERTGDGARRLEIGFDGPRGTWRLAGDVREDGNGRFADVQAYDVPIEDVMLLAGLSAVPAGVDLKLSARVTAAFAGNKLQRFEGAFASSAGSIAPAGQAPIRIDGLSGNASWNEAATRLDIGEIQLRSGVSGARLSGVLGPAADGNWQLALAGRDASVAGATPGDGLVKLSDVAAQLTFGDAGIAVDRLAMSGEGLKVTVTGATYGTAAGAGMRATIEAADTSVRRFLALWPDPVNPDLRRYLSANMRDGVLKLMRLETELDPHDLVMAFSARPISDKALKLSFTLQDAVLTVADGLPPLRQLGVVGSATGTSTTLDARRGAVEMPDGRRLSFLDGSYHQADEDKPGSVANIAFRLEGGADAVASLLRSPVFKETGSFDLDPAKVKGRADLKVTLPLSVHHIPPIAELPLTVTGTFADVAMERVFGRETLEGGKLAVAYESGALGIKGEGRIGGSPATFELRQPRSRPGEVQAVLTLDEAARTRRSLPSAPQVTGPVQVKVTMPFGQGAKGPTRLEADLARAGIDGLLPGWTKPSGRPGRLSLTMADGQSTELRDLVVDSGAVQLRGTAVLGSDGGLEKADLATLKLSAGDDLKAQLDKSGGGYRINLKGNVGDARPVLKWLTDSSPGAGGQKGRDGAAKEPPDLDIDAAVNIVTGHNDEAMTGVAAKITTRGRDLRSLQIRGKFRSAALEAQLARRDAGPPQLVVRSGDAGATLRFLDIYKRMVGGDLSLQTTIGDAGQAGKGSIDGFILRNEPALRSIASQGTVQSGSDERANAITARLASDEVQFTKLTGEFRRNASRTEYKDVVIWGAQVGFTLGGYVDNGRDRTEILGTFVPAYGLNNAFSQVPIVGLILGGGNTNEGLFAIDFRISGLASAPTLTVNPLTAVAPGILRKLFGWMLPEEDATGATAAPEAEDRPARRKRER